MNNNLLRLLFVFSILLLSCEGTRDYPQPTANGQAGTLSEPPPPPPSSSPIDNNQPIKNGKGNSEEQEPILMEHEYPVGYLWEGMNWLGIPENNLVDFMNFLADSPDINAFTALGSSFFGGAALGLLVRSSGSWFFGGPIKSEASHWFWKRLNISFNTISQGLLRGGIFAGACHIALTGIYPIPYQGLLGQEFHALSSAVILGTLSSIAADPYIRKLVNHDWSKGKVPAFLRHGVDKIHQWTHQNTIGLAIRHRIGPRVLVIGIGFGVGLVIYNNLQGDEESEVKHSLEPIKPVDFNLKR